MTRLELVAYILIFAFAAFMAAGAIFWPEYKPFESYKYAYMVTLLGVLGPLLAYARRQAKP